ncbi:MAG: hypothetical protein NVV57_00825 [Demequina sp.]|nr:hypothetical protein [Demequina sp.]
MIEHDPAGTGHAYREEVQRRVPFHPVAGQTFRVGAKASDDIVSVMVQLELLADDGEAPLEEFPAAWVPGIEVADAGAVVTAEGHLAAGQASGAASDPGWIANLPAREGERYRYRFAASGPAGVEQTRWFFVNASSWVVPDAVVAVGGRDRIVPGSSAYLTDGDRVHRVRFEIALQPSERVVGFGERYERLDQRGHSIDNRVFDQYTGQDVTGRTYFPMPFAHVIGGDGWGFHVRASGQAWIDVGQTATDRIRIEAEVDRPLPADGNSALEVAFYDGSPAQVLDAFLAETGRPQELPDWVLRLWASSNEWNTQAEVERQIALHREHGIPVGALVIEAWSDEVTFTVFRDAQYEVRYDGTPLRATDITYPPDGAWPNPQGMIDAMHDEGIHLLLWQIPLLETRVDVADAQIRAMAVDGEREGVMVRRPREDGRLTTYANPGYWFPGGLSADLLDERAQAWWTKWRRYLVEDLGVDGFKTDGGEHMWGPSGVFLDGTTGAESNNRFPVGYAEAYGKLLSSAGKAPVTFSRAGYTGSQAHGIFWAGDEQSTWRAFRSSMIAGLNASASGVLYWGWDIAGFSGEIPDAELYLRAFAASAFVPIMQYHSEYSFHRSPSRDRTPWNIAQRRGEPSVIDHVRDIVALRERLVPRLARWVRASIATGQPLMRPLWFAEPSDSEVWERPLQWMLGDDVLVAPVLEPGVTTWATYLPSGEWVDAWTRREVAGGQLVDADVSDLARVPVFVRATAWPDLAEVFRSN